MALKLLAIAVAAVAAAPAVSPPNAPGQWKQIGPAMTSKLGKALHFYRLPQNPKQVGIVLTSTSSHPIRLSWENYCEFQSDDEMTGDEQAVASGVHSVVVYPPVVPNGATQCYVWVNTNAIAGAKISAAVFFTS